MSKKDKDKKKIFIKSSFWNLQQKYLKKDLTGLYSAKNKDKDKKNKNTSKKI